MTSLIAAGGRLLKTTGPQTGIPSANYGFGGGLTFDGVWTDRSEDEGSEHKLISYSELYNTQPVIAAAINKLTRQGSTLPLKVYRRNSSGDRERLYGHPLVELLRQPLPRRSPVHLKQWILMPLLSHGNGLIAKFRETPDGPPTALLPVSWPEVEAYAPQGGYVEWWATTQTGQRRWLAVEDTLHFAWESPQGEIGTSPLQQLGTTIQIEDAAQRYQRAMFKNSARPTGAIQLPAGPPIPPEIRKEMRADIERLYSGIDNAGRMVLLQNGAEWKTMAHSAHEAALIQQRILSREEIAMVYDLPGPLIGDLTHGTYCLPADALVAAEQGSVPITDITAGDRVWSVCDGELKLRPVSWSGQTGVKPLLTIKTQNRTLRCTDNHPLLIARPNRRRERRGTSKSAYAHEWMAAGELERGDILVTATRLPDHGVRSCPTRENVTVGFAEFCGLLMGDGNVDRDSRSGQPSGVSIARSSEARYMDHYRAVAEREFESYDRGNSKQVERATCAVKLQEQDRSTRFSSVLAASELTELGLAGTAHTKRVPEWVFQLEPELRAAFVRGFCDADGSVDKKGHVSVHSANEFLLRQVRELFMGLGVPVCNARANRSWVTLPNGRKLFSVMWNFKASDPAVNAAVIGSHDPQDAARMAAGKPWGEKTYRYPNRMGELPPAIGGCGHARITSIEVGEASVPVYDIEVPETHNFIAEGVVVHNSNVTELNKQLYKSVLRPWLTLIEETIQAHLIDPEPEWEGLFVEFDMGEVLRGSKVEEIDAAVKSFTNGLMTLNEIRAVLNLPKIEDAAADKPHIPANNLQPLGARAADPEIPPTT